MCSGGFGQFVGREPAAVRHGPVEAGAVADQDGGGVEDGAEVGSEAADELPQALFVDLLDGGVSGSIHDVTARS